MNINYIKANVRCAVAAALAACTLWLTGCIDTGDDRSVCTADMTFRFEYTLNRYSTDMFGQTADAVDLFIYGESGAFVRRVHLNRSEGTLPAGNTATVNLPHGNYTAVAWANLHNGDFDCVYECPMSQKLVSLKIDNSQVSDAPSHLMHGLKEFSVSKKDSEAGEILVPMTKNTNNVRVILNLKGDTSDISADSFIMTITGSNGTYKFDNSYGACSPFTYIPECSMPNAERVQGEFNLLRIQLESDLRLNIAYNSTRADVELPLTDLLSNAIMEHPLYTGNTDLDRYDEFVLEYDVTIPEDGGPAIILMIKVNDWIVVDWDGPIGN